MDKLCREDTYAIIIQPAIVIGSLQLSKHSSMLSDFLFYSAYLGNPPLHFGLCPVYLSPFVPEDFVVAQEW